MIKICKRSELALGQIKNVDIEDKKIVLINLDEKIYALDRICTHSYADLSIGIVNDDTITCPLHFAQFNLKTGEATSMPATEPLKQYEIIIKDDDVFLNDT